MDSERPLNGAAATTASSTTTTVVVTPSAEVKENEAGTTDVSIEIGKLLCLFVFDCLIVGLID